MPNIIFFSRTFLHSFEIFRNESLKKYDIFILTSNLNNATNKSHLVVKKCVAPPIPFTVNKKEAPPWIGLSF